MGTGRSFAQAEIAGFTMTSPTIAIIGSGAVGGYYGARLAQHGHPVHFLLRSDYEFVRANGWLIKSCDGDFSLRPDQINLYRTPGEMPPVDLVIVTLKTTANADFPALIAPLLKEDTAILTLQNGLGNEEELAGLFGARRILGGLAFTCINRVAPGQIRHTAHGLIRLGEFRGGPSPRVNKIAELFNASRIQCQVLENLQYGRWDKLVWNVPFNGLGAALDLSADRLIANAAGRSLIEELMREVIATAATNGIRLPDEIIAEKIGRTREMGVYSTSMQLDRRSGKPLETQAIVGRPLAVAENAGLKTPFLKMLFLELNTFG
jgi:2-dehydropantoate 2-reductase